MQITFTPQRHDTPLTLHRQGDVLIVDGIDYDFGPVPEGGLLPREAVDCPRLASDVARLGGVLHLTLILPHGADAPPETLFPAPLALTADGPVALPPFNQPNGDANVAD